MSNERETCLICFNDYLIRNTKEHQCPEQDETKERLCQLCGEQIKDLTQGAIVLPWGETCADCLKEIKK